MITSIPPYTPSAKRLLSKDYTLESWNDCVDVDTDFATFSKQQTHQLFYMKLVSLKSVNDTIECRLSEDAASKLSALGYTVTKDGDDTYTISINKPKKIFGIF